MKCLNIYIILLVVFLSNSVTPQTVTHYCGAINLPNPTNSNCGDNSVCSRTTCMATPSDMIVNPYTSDVYVVETAAHRIRRIQYGTTGMVSTVVGFVSGVNGGDVDGLGTTIAKIKNPRSIDFSKPYLYFSDEGNNKVKRYNLASLLVATIANVSQITYPGALRVYNDRLYLSVVTGGITIQMKRQSLLTFEVTTFMASSYARDMVVFRGFMYAMIAYRYDVAKVNLYSGAILGTLVGDATTPGVLDGSCGLDLDCKRKQLYMSDCTTMLVKRYKFDDATTEEVAGKGKITAESPLTTGPNFYNQFQLYTPISAVGMNSVLLILEQDGNRMDVVTTTESVASLGTGCGFTKTRSTTIEYGTVVFCGKGTTGSCGINHTCDSINVCVESPTALAVNPVAGKMYVGQSTLFTVKRRVKVPLMDPCWGRRCDS
eukprot:PhF_6_TR12868/c0_g1_i2/m.20223